MTDPSRALHEMEPTKRFSNCVSDYVRYRPTYPREAAMAVVSGMGPAEGLTIADIGAGTGISTRVLASSGARVIAVEPNDQMRAAGERDAAGEGLRIAWVAGTAEATGLPEATVDIVACAQAFHWFRAPAALAEFARVLQRPGRVALIWNDRDTNDELSRGYSALIDAASDGHAAANDHTRPGPLYESALFRDARELTFNHRQRLNLPGLIGRATSASYIPKEGPKLDKLKQSLTDLFVRHETAGEVQLHYVTRVFLAEKA